MWTYVHREFLTIFGRCINVLNYKYELVTAIDGVVSCLMPNMEIEGVMQIAINSLGSRGSLAMASLSCYKQKFCGCKEQCGMMRKVKNLMLINLFIINVN